MSPEALVLSLLALVALERAIELHRSRLHVRRLRARGAVEYGAEQYPLMVAAHVAFHLVWAIEALVRRHPVDLWTAAWLGGFALAQGLRLWTIAALGERWTTRVLVLPGAPLVRRGPYRYFRHPNYIVVVVEMVTLSVALRAPVALALAVASQAWVLSRRIRIEEAALRGADSVPA